MSSVIIMNANGVALATDSAHVISDQNNYVKTAPTANKIYRLCPDKRSPISIVLCDNHDFNGVPFELLIMDFRKKHPGPWKTVDACREKFLKYLSVGSIEKASYDEYFLYADIDTSIDDIRKQSSNMNCKELEMFLNDILSLKMPKWEQFKKIKPYTAEQKKKLVEYINVKCDFVCENRERIIAKIVEICLDEISILYKFDFCPGIGLNVAICGYGTTEYYPSLSQLRLVGTARHKLLYLEGIHKSVSYDDPSIICTTGIGSDTIEMLLYGENKVQLSNQINTARNFCRDLRLEAISKFGKGPDSEIVKRINKKFEEVHRATTDKFIRNRKKVSSTMGSYNLMDIAKIAKMLIDISAFRQQLEMGGENIGGPVDAGFITKQDGFQWFSRKLYFDPSINKHMFEKK